jgi:stringent starvation protein B
MINDVVPYLIRAYCDWMEDSDLTPYILVDCEKKEVVVPKGLAKDGKIILNISSSAVGNRRMTKDAISFKARFNGASEEINVPCGAVLTIYAQENGEGMFFDNNSEGLPDSKEKPSLTILD